MDVRRATQWSHSAAVLGLGFLAVLVQPVQAQGPLNYFKNYFVTGDYAVGGVGLYGKTVNGSVTGAINFSGVPCTGGPGFFAGVQPCSAPGAVPADIVAAFLYWQAIETTPAPSYAIGSFDATSSNPNPFISVALGNTNVAACATGGATQSGAYTRVYRADVLRYLPINSAANVRTVNGAHTIQLKSNSTGTQFVGATLVVVYRLVAPGNPRIAPLRSVVLYDGAFTGTASLGLNQTMGGFYQASFDSDARMTQIVGNGQSISKGERQTLSVNGAIPEGVPANPFVGAQGANWDNYTFNINLAPNASSVGTQVQLTQDCLSWAAIVTSTNVQDSDADGLLDVWETSGLALNPGVRNDGTPAPTLPVPATFGTCTNYPASCVNLPAMGANPFIPDIFMQIDWMQSKGLSNPDHIHNPQPAALNMVGDVFKTHGINLHFDVGGSSTYQGQQSSYIIPAKYTQGGNVVQESSILCQYPPSAPSCNFSPQSGQYSVLGWKTGLDAIKNGDPFFPCPIIPSSPAVPCTPTGLPQLFAQNRKDTFHYALFGHALAATSPSSFPNLASISGVADRPGGDLMVTLGLWRSDIASNDQVGSVLQQAGTLMHELGHNLDLSHAGWRTTPNCMPDYPSVMNYLYQTRGLTDASGNEQIDYSYGLELPLVEGFLSSAIPMGLQKYRVRYFGPLNSAINSQGQASQVHCDGTLLSTGAAEGQYVRLEGSSVSTPDWSNGTVVPLGKLITSGLDINYNGVLGETFTDQPDWFSLNLQQVGARPNADGLSLNIGVSDIGVSDIGVSDIGVSDIGVSDIGVSDIGVSDIGVSDIGTANLGQDSLGDEDFITHLLSGVDAPASLTAAVQAITQSVTVNGNQLSWTPPATGTVYQYNIYRCNASAAACIPAPPLFSATTTGTTGRPAPTTYIDTPNDFVDAGTTCPVTATCYNTPYTYYVTAVVVVAGKSVESGPSNSVGSQVNHLFVVANSQSVVYGSANPVATFNIYGNVSGSLSAGAVTCAYPSPAINAGNYPINCSGPATTSATDGVTYLTGTAAYLTHTQGSLTISPRPITVTAAASGKVYDATTSSSAAPTITTGSLAYNDTPAFIETYDNRNVGTAHVMTPAGIVNDGNNGQNYRVTFVTINTGVITPAPLTIAAITNTKTYDGTANAAAIPSVTGLKGSDTVTGLIETYNTSNAGNNLVLTVSAGYTVNDGNGGNNYSVGTTTNTTGVINPAPVTASITAANKTYDTTATATITGCSLTGVLAADAGKVTCSASGGTFASANAGTWTVTATPSLAGTAAGNYALPPGLAGTTATISPAPVTVALTNLVQTYSGGPLMPTVTTSPVTVAVSLTGAPQAGAGRYPVTAVVTNPNYTGSANGVFVISPYPLTVSATGVNRDFDGTTKATVALSDNRISPNDTFTDSYLSAGFSDPNPGVGKPVSVTGISISGPGATNYTLASTTAATTANISDAIDLSALSLNGVNYGSNTPALPVWTAATGLQLTNTTTETASSWLGTSVPVGSAFTTTFQFQIVPPASGPNSIGDGFAFVIQAAPAGNATLGQTGAGEYIGYAGISNSLAVEFDTYQNNDLADPAGPHIGIQSLGTAPNAPNHGTAANLGGPVQVGFADGRPHSATIAYNGTTLSVSVDGNFVVSAPVALGTLLNPNGGANAFIGFTAATGEAQQSSSILSWTWN